MKNDVAQLNVDLLDSETCTLRPKVRQRVEHDAPEIKA